MPDWVFWMLLLVANLPVIAQIRTRKQAFFTGIATAIAVLGLLFSVFRN